MATAGKRTGSRRGRKQRSLPSRTAVLHCLGVTVSVVAWGYLVYAAIDFGATAREGDGRAWGFLALACVGAAACLFAGLILGAKVLRLVGILAPLARPEPVDPPLPGFGSAEPRETPPSYRDAAELEDPAPTATIPTQADPTQDDPAPTATIPAQRPDQQPAGTPRTPARYQGKRVAR
ncbi:hypothetical protein ACLM5J_00985 [Nocardioides sp. Bht2]|uniref:hypothetical protein n=1 Tax=Nocardioides sp. Bht2 TaxID=3392297 RepID=UPI0039B59A6A